MRKKKKREARTFLAATVDRVGLRESTKVLTFVICWTTVHHDLGHLPTIEEYAVWWKQSSRTAYRELAGFREAWPEFSTPSDVAAALGVNLEEQAMPNPAAMPVPT